MISREEAWATNPDASAFTGPVLPYELETRAQVTFEEMGGFGNNFNRVRFGREQADSSSYPCGAGMFGCGCNMVFRRTTLLKLNGFDDALEEVSIQQFDRIAGPRGVERAAEAAARVDCPVVPELLRPLT